MSKAAGSPMIVTWPVETVVGFDGVRRRLRLERREGAHAYELTQRDDDATEARIEIPFDIASELAGAIAEAEAGPREATHGYPGAINARNLQHLRWLPRGWAVLFLDLLAELPEDFQIDWAREKLGELRCSSREEHSQVLEKYELRSMRTCAVCGAPGRMQQRDGLHLPHCVPCGMLHGFSDPQPRVDA